jgi:hypothetical protein
MGAANNVIESASKVGRWYIYAMLVFMTLCAISSLVMSIRTYRKPDPIMIQVEGTVKEVSCLGSDKECTLVLDTPLGERTIATRGTIYVRGQTVALEYEANDPTAATTLAVCCRMSNKRVSGLLLAAALCLCILAIALYFFRNNKLVTTIAGGKFVAGFF